VLAKLQHPAVINLRIGGAPVELQQAYPAELPDLFFGEELVVFGRYHGTGAGEVVVTGERNGRRERFTARAEFPATASANEFIPRLWASRRIGDLTRQIRIEGATQSLVQQVRELGLRYGILTEYTAYLVQEPGVGGLAPAAPARLDAAAMGGAPAAAQQTGRTAFARAQASAAMSGAGDLATADRIAGARMAELAAAAPRGAVSVAVRRVGGRVFVQREGVWTDAAHQDSLHVTRVAAFSDAYFALVRALPELAPYLGVGDEVVVAGRRASVRFGTGGVTAWQPGELEALVRSFRRA